MNRATVALVGNPNSGKTTLFNGLTGGRIKTGNWPGVTVEKREGTIKYGHDFVTVVDLPGIYSFSAYSEDEKIARDYALSGEASFVINIIDASNLERNLYLTTQLIEMKVPVFVVINMMDVAEKRNIKIDTDSLAQRLGIPVYGVNALEKKDIERVKKGIYENLKAPAVPTAEIVYPNEIENLVNVWSKKVKKTKEDLAVDGRWIILKLIENDELIRQKVIKNHEVTAEEIDLKTSEVEKILGDSADILCADYRYGFIHGISKAVVKKTETRRSLTDLADKLILNRFLGIPFFLLIMYAVFWATITVGGSFVDFFDRFFGAVCVDGFGVLLENLGSPQWLTVILAEGVGGGIQTVSTFVPIIFMMFFMLAILEDSGYMARAAFVMDRFMRLLGLPGKAFVPLLVGFGCTVPAVMGTRTLENKKDRLLTIFMAPFMSCGARLPVYALFAAAFFPTAGGRIVFSLYMTGILFAVMTGLLMKKTLFKGDTSYFIMELPPYHRPRFRHIFLHTWERLKDFIYRAGKVIVAAVLVLNFLSSLGVDGSFGHNNSSKSVLTALGQFVTPVFAPMGIEKENWPATVGLFTGIFAKEAIVGTLNALYARRNSSEKSGFNPPERDKNFDFIKEVKRSFAAIPEGFKNIFPVVSDQSGEYVSGRGDQHSGRDRDVFGIMHRYFSGGKMQAYAYLLFVLLYFPCLAALGAVVKEAGLFFGFLNAFYLTVLAWIVSTLFYQITIGHSLLWIATAFLLFTGLAAMFYFISVGKKLSH